MGVCLSLPQEKIISPKETTKGEPSPKSRHGRLSSSGLHGAIDSSRSYASATDLFPNPISFTRKEMEAATCRFRGSNVIGQGGFGKVYLGVLRRPEGQCKVAIKRLNTLGMDGYAEWLAEVILLGKLSHPNLVRLIGHCSAEREVMLVYEFAAQGSLDNVLFERGVLPWEARVRIAQNIACGLAYLHSRRIIHRDLKASNVLLREDLSAMVADVGLAKTGPQQDETHVSTQVKGSFGYLDPNYFSTGHLNFKSDVYSYGVLLLELVTGRPCVDLSKGGVSVVAWAKRHLEQTPYNMDAIVDERLQRMFDPQEAEALLEMAEKCIHADGDERPTFELIVESLGGLNKGRDGAKEGSQEGPNGGEGTSGDEGNGKDEGKGEGEGERKEGGDAGVLVAEVDGIIF
eukprot:TRINITY_DN1158_c0_g1_i1.p1 TRINITY_DN1158_c0_g1~~TRINITY_DN1158_c0_g1_i1.p1  ORF type:complete len:402 (-),score=75.37 TRINITY_DN1158_c0_g1_i1:568-1773(-)